jgi:hypothetical protein
MRTIDLTKGLWAIVDDDDFPWLNRFKWLAHHNPPSKPMVVREFSIISPNGKTVSYYMPMASFLMGTRPGMVVDHVNGNPLDNRKENLRWATRAQNAINWRRANSFGRGVAKNGKGFVARIMAIPGGKKLNLGTFPTEQEAQAAYDSAALLFHGEFAVLNGAK